MAVSLAEAAKIAGYDIDNVSTGLAERALLAEHAGVTAEAVSDAFEGNGSAEDVTKIEAALRADIS